jgi:peptidoglycan/LPS O-acetylase OafA/YrhL
MLAWTLAYEIYFYFAISVIVLLIPGHIFRGIAIWACLSFSLLGYATITGNGWTQYVFASPLTIEFTIGAAIAYLVRRRIFIHPWLSVAAGAIGFAIGSRFNTDWAVWSRTLCFAAPAGLIVYGVVALEIDCRRVMPVVLQRLGDASYSIYLWHQLLFFAIFAIFDHLGWIDGIPRGILVICWIMAVFPTTLLIHRFVEAPMLELLNRALFSRIDRSTSERSVAGENPIIPLVSVPGWANVRERQ